MLTVAELRELALRLDEAEFERQVGPFALVQRPPKAVLAMAAEQLGAKDTVPFRRGTKEESSRVMDLVLSFDTLVLATLPPVRDVDTLTIGRLPDCDVVVENPSVSKRHAELTWDGEALRAIVRDLGSRNGTRVDNVPLAGETTVHDGDVVSVGDVDYWFLLARSLHRRLTK